MDRHAIATALARDDKAAVDCHADKSARNDNENAANKKVDSRGFDERGDFWGLGAGFWGDMLACVGEYEAWLPK